MESAAPLGMGTRVESEGQRGEGLPEKGEERIEKEEII